MVRRERKCRKEVKGVICGKPHYQSGLCEEHYRQWASRSGSRFQSGRGNRKGGVIKCLACGKDTRDTGYDEGSLEMCKWCIRQSELLNSMSDGSISREEYDDAVAKLKAGIWVN